MDKFQVDWIISNLVIHLVMNVLSFLRIAHNGLAKLRFNAA